MPSVEKRRWVDVLASSGSLVVFGVTAALSIGLAADNVQAADVWHKVFSRPFDSLGGNNRIFRMAKFDGHLYQAAGREGGIGASVYRLNHAGCAIWDNVTPPWPANTPGPVLSLLVFNSHLYVGNELGQVWRFNGGSWDNVTGNLPVPSGSSTISLFDMAAFNGQLYVDYGGQIWRTTNSGIVPHSWQLAWSPSFTSPNPDPSRVTIESLEVFGGQLYAGVGHDAPYGFQIWRTSNGTMWTLFQDETYSGPFLSILGHVHALRTLGSMLYVGEYHGTGFYRTDGSSWNYFNAAQTGAGDVFRFADRSGTLYLGTSNLSSSGTSGTPLLYSSPNGSSWAAVASSPVVSSASHSITALEDFGGKLYVATAGNSEIAVWELGAAPAPTCDPPVLDIDANGSDGPVTLTGGNLKITVAIQTGTTLAGVNAEWWVWGIYIDPVSLAWIPFALPQQQYPLINLPAIPIVDLPHSMFPKGAYWWIFSVDLQVNGFPNIDAMFWDAVLVEVK